MDILEKKRLIEKHHNYKYLLMDKNKLTKELKKWCRQDLINWLKWNDPNGVYDDEQSLKELGNIMTYEEGVEIILRQVFNKNFLNKNENLLIVDN